MFKDKQVCLNMVMDVLKPSFCLETMYASFKNIEIIVHATLQIEVTSVSSSLSSGHQQVGQDRV